MEATAPPPKKKLWGSRSRSGCFVNVKSPVMAMSLCLSVQTELALIYQMDRPSHITALRLLVLVIKSGKVLTAMWMCLLIRM